MDKNIKELMQISVISENTELSNLIKDIIPTKEQRFTNLELEADKKQEFSLVVYKKVNPLVSFIRSIKFTFEKIRIMKHSKEFDLAKNQNKY
ncbi:MAG TPA: hypothetical protein DEP51_02090 [Clostridiales bacterium]|nr:hypothetical protein [Clostridiales bacterium]